MTTYRYTREDDPDYRATLTVDDDGTCTMVYGDGEPADVTVGALGIRLAPMIDQVVASQRAQGFTVTEED